MRLKTVAASVIIGTILYLSKFLRPFVSDSDSTLFVLGFTPNFGLAFAIPFIYVSNRVRLKKPVEHFSASCVATLLLMILNEIRDRYQSGRVFDWLDVYASLGGVTCAFIVYRAALKELQGKHVDPPRSADGDAVESL